MSKSKIGVVGLGLVGLGSTILASPAQAAMSCGTAPTGGTLVSGVNYCQLTFSTSGSYSVTIPNSASELYAILVGSGSGAGADQNVHVAYAGSGGRVKYVNLTNQINTEITVNVGAGGTSSTNQSATPGVDTAVIWAGGGNSAWTGNYSSNGSDYCSIPSFNSNTQSYIMYLGVDSKLGRRLANANDTCTNGHGLGINPSAGDPDTDGNPVPAIFSNYNAKLGTGGEIAISTAPAAAGFGAGGSLTVSDVDLAFSNVQSGQDGAAIFRWKQTELSNTGSNSQELSIMAAGLITLGAGLMVGSRVRRRVQK